VRQAIQPEIGLLRRESLRLPPVLVWEISIICAIVLWLYWPIMVHLFSQWFHDPNFSHGFFVPLFSAFVLWRKRVELGRIPHQPSWLGLPVLTFGLAALIGGQLGAELFLSRFSLLLVLAGLTLHFFGWNLFKTVLFAWAVLILMIPLPAIIFNQITFPLQLLASRVASTALPLFGVPVLREGNIIHLPSLALEVADACSGIRSLISLVTLAVIYGYLTEKRPWMRGLLVLASVPIAIFANSLRIIGTGLLVQYWDPEKAEGYFHASWGWIIFGISLLMLYGLQYLMHWIWRERRGER
jgi:exosortase